MKTKIFLAITVFAVSLAGCSSTASNTMVNANIAAPRSTQYPSDKESVATTANTASEAKSKTSGARLEGTPSGGASTSSAPPQSAPKPIERKIIRNADLILESDTPEEAQRKISEIAESRNGFVVETSSSSSNSDLTVRDVVNMTVRVPSEKFNESLEEIRKTSKRVIQENIKGQDVTEEFVDMEARLKAKKALEAQFLEIMKQARTIEDSLNVQSEIAAVRGEIEQIEGRMRYLENQSSLSTIKIRLQTSGTRAPNSEGFFYQLQEAFGDGFSAASYFLLFLVRAVVALLPFLLIVVLPIFLLIRYFVKRRKREKLASEILREEEIKSE